MIGDDYSPLLQDLAFTTCRMNHELTSRTVSKNKNKNINKNKRRFSDEQIKSLEDTFESETKLEPRKKMELATELGLQPRQVAIWFQNKRARWKSNQLEKEYSVLMANYNILASRFDAVKKEKEALIIQLQKLHERKEKLEEDENKCFEETRGIDKETKNKFDAYEFGSELKSTISIKRLDHEVGILSDDEENVLRNECFDALDKKENEEKSMMITNIVESAESSLTTIEDWENFDSNDIFDKSSNSNEWWDFLP